MLNEAPNNNDVTHVTNIVLNKAPNSEDTMLIGNNRLTTMGAQQISMSAIEPSCRKANLPETRDSDTTTRKIHVDGTSYD